MTYNGPLEKVDDFRWKIPRTYKSGMRTDAIVFADEGMVPKLKEDNAPEQAANVAFLPGIVGNSLAMPDIHWGYGFPIGGVAALDAEEGVISPGGIGFDINCLCEGSRISTDLGGWMRIEDFEEEFGTTIQTNDGFTVGMMGGTTSVMTLERGLVARKPAAFIRKESDKRVFLITTRTGIELRASEDHPVLTSIGMKNAALIAPGDQVAVTYFQGVEVDQNVDRREVVLAKLFGYMLGAGSLDLKEGGIIASVCGQRTDLEKMKRDLADLGYDSTVAGPEIRVSSREFSDLLVERGMPVGSKTISDQRVPEWVTKAAPAIKRAFLAGLFGAELTMPKADTKTTFDPPMLVQKLDDARLDDARMFYIDVMMLLEDLGVEKTQICERKDLRHRNGSISRLTMSICANEDNLIRLYRIIGFEYSEMKSKMAEAAVKYMLLKKELNDSRVKAAERARKLKKKGLKLKEVQTLLVGYGITPRFVEKQYNGEGQRPSVDFTSFSEFLDQELDMLKATGFLYDRVTAVKEVPYKGFVYDFTVPETHNFVADGMIVSNCGVRLVRTELEAKDVQPGIKDLISTLFKNVPAGVGSKGIVGAVEGQIDNILVEGAEWAVRSGYGWDEDLTVTEEGGRMKNADPTKVSGKAKQRGVPQVGSLGSGNHFLEVDVVDEIFDEEAARAFGLREGQVTVMVHCGSRGCGHQIATDYLQVMEKAMRQRDMNLPDRQLACAPVHSKEGEDYFKAMACGANYAWANRQMILHWIRESFEEHFKHDAESMGLHQVYDVAHNIAKVEEHQVDGRRREVYVHRKGATRAFPREHPEIPRQYSSVGQPVLIPGDMGSGSYVLVGTERGMAESFGSTCHGAGRMMSRTEALRKFTVQGIKQDMEHRGIFLKSATKDGILEEAPEAYKNIEQVIDVVAGAGLSRRVARLTPLGVMKG